MNLKERSWSLPTCLFNFLPALNTLKVSVERMIEIQPISGRFVTGITVCFARDKVYP
jgi:hypothetical protein